jgi:hypothetical protein
MMATVHAQDPQRKDIFPVEADGPAATVAPVGSDKMTQLSSVYDQMHCPPYDTHKDGLEKAYEACLDRVRPTEDPGLWQVQSKQHAEVWYQVRGPHCTCPYSNIHPREAWGCYHTIAARLYQRWQQALAPLVPSPTPKETPMDETMLGEEARAGVQMAPPQAPLIPEVLPAAVARAPGTMLTAEALTASLAAWSEHRAILARFIRQHLVEGTDYGKLHIKKDCKQYKCTNPSHLSKDTLFKSGGEKFCGLLRLRPTFRKDEDTWEMLGRPPGVICLVCQLLTPRGEVLGEGRGIRDVKKDGDDYNKAVKMTEKSACLDAILRTGGLSDVFTQDLDEGQEERPPTPPAAARAVEDAGTATPEQRQLRRQIQQLLHTLGHTPDSRSAYETLVLQHTGLALVPIHYAAIVARLTAQARPAPASPA